MGAGYATKLRGNCLNLPQNNYLSFLKTINFHLTFSSPECSNQRQGGLFGPGSSPLLVPAVPYTQPIPYNYIPPGNSVNLMRYYGRDNPLVNLTTLNGTPVWFDTNEINPWRKKFYCPAPYNRYDRAGPAITTPHCYGSATRKPMTAPAYKNRQAYSFVDSFELPHSEYKDLNEICGPGCKIRNFLIFMGGVGGSSADYIYCTQPEPFLVDTHFEQCGESPSTDTSKGGLMNIPFSAPMNARLADGKLIGSYKAFAFSIVFGNCALVAPINPYLPPDEWSTALPPRPKVNPLNQFFSAQVSVYMVGESLDPDDIVLGSPLLTRYRYYFYSKPGGDGQTLDWRYPFRVLGQQTIYGSEPVTLALNVLQQPTQEQIYLNFTNARLLVTY